MTTHTVSTLRLNPLSMRRDLATTKWIARALGFSIAVACFTLLFFHITDRDRLLDVPDSFIFGMKDAIPQRGIVLSSQCSGSTWLCSTLNSSMHVLWGGEEMHKYTKLSNTEWKTVSWNTYKKDLQDTFNRLLREAQNSRQTISLVGFKLMYDQLPDSLYKPFAEWLNDNEIVVIHLVRKGSVLRYASHVEKRQRIRNGGKARYTEMDELMKDTGNNPLQQKIELNDLAMQVIQRHEQHMEEFSSYLRAHAPLAPYLEVSYEQLTGPHQERLFRSMSGFLRIPVVMSADDSPLLRMNHGTCANRVANLERDTGMHLLEGTRSKSECLMMEAAYNATFRRKMTELLPTATGNRCRFKFSHCKDSIR